jgi:hypothetical protein
MGSGFDYRIYCHFFTITANCGSSQSMTVYDSPHSLLDYESLLFHCDGCRTTNHCSHFELPSDLIYERITTPPDPNISHHLKRFLCYSALSVATEICVSDLLPSNDWFFAICCSGNVISDPLLSKDFRSDFTISAFRRWLRSRCLAIDYSVTIYSHLNITSTHIIGKIQ